MSILIKGMEQDLKRLIQCVICANDPETCGCTDDDEDEQGFCLNYRKREWKGE